MIDLLGGVPAEGDLWVRSQVERGGKQIELVSAEMLAPGPDGQPRPVARASGWRLQQLDTQAVVHAPAPPLRPLTEARNRDLKAKDWDRNYVHSLEWRWLTEPLTPGPGESWINPTVDLVKGETMTPLERLFAVADCANGIGSKLDITQVDVPEHRPGRARVPHSRRGMDRYSRGDQLRAGRHRDDGRHVVRRAGRGRRHPAVGAGAPAPRRSLTGERLTMSPARATIAETDTSTRQRILAATAEVLGRNGKTKLSLSDVATQAGVSRPTLYRWFASKEELLSAFSSYERQIFESGLARATAG